MEAVERQRVRYAISDARRHELGPRYCCVYAAESPKYPYPDKPADRYQPDDGGGCEWPLETYSYEFPDNGYMRVGTWRVDPKGKSKVSLQPTNEGEPAPVTADSSPFQDKELVPQPNAARKVRTGYDRHGDDLAGDAVPRPYPRPKLWGRMSEEDFCLLQLIYWFDCLHVSSATRPSLRYVPRSGKGKRRQVEADFLASWLHEFRERGFPSSILERITGRSQQGVSRLLGRQQKRLPVEPEPWASRRRANEKNPYGVRPQPFSPNYSTDTRPYWASKDPGVSPAVPGARGVPRFVDAAAGDCSSSARASYPAKAYWATDPGTNLYRRHSPDNPGDDDLTTLERLERIERRFEEIQRDIADSTQRIREQFPTDPEVSKAVDTFLETAGVSSDTFEEAA